MNINVEMAIVVALFVIGALVIALDNVLDYSYRRLAKFFQSKQVPPKPSRPTQARNLLDL